MKFNNKTYHLDANKRDGRYRGIMQEQPSQTKSCHYPERMNRACF